MIVTVGGKQYEISGIGYGTNPVWAFIKHDGKRMTGAEFKSLPPAEQHELAECVQKHADRMNDLRK